MDIDDYLQRGYNCEVHALQKRIKELEELLQSATCIYCGETFSKDSDLAAHVHSCESHPLSKAIAERDLYKPYYDAIVDLAIVNWTLDEMSLKDVHHAIQRIVLQHAQEACDPQLNEELAKLKQRAEAAEDKLSRITSIVDRWYNSYAPANTGEYDMEEIQSILN